MRSLAGTSLAKACPDLAASAASGGRQSDRFVTAESSWQRQVCVEMCPLPLDTHTLEIAFSRVGRRFGRRVDDDGDGRTRATLFLCFSFGSRASPHASR